MPRQRTQLWIKYPRRNLRLTSADFEQLQLLAGRYNCVTVSGPSCGSPSWRTLIRYICRGDLVIYRPPAGIPTLPAGDDVSRQVIQLTPEDWEKLDHLATLWRVADWRLLLRSIARGRLLLRSGIVD